MGFCSFLCSARHGGLSGSTFITSAKQTLQFSRRFGYNSGCGWKVGTLRKMRYAPRRASGWSSWVVEFYFGTHLGHAETGTILLCGFCIVSCVAEWDGSEQRVTRFLCAGLALEVVVSLVWKEIGEKWPRSRSPDIDKSPGGWVYLIYDIANREPLSGDATRSWILLTLMLLRNVNHTTNAVCREWLFFSLLPL